MATGENKTIYAALLGNLAITAMKFAAAFISGSPAMMAEAFHSSADSGNQLMLLVGQARARKPADDEHPFGYGKEIYFWAFMVAVSIFFVGGALSIYEGLHKLAAPPAETGFPVWPLAVLGGAALLEGGSWLVAMREAAKMKTDHPGQNFVQLATRTKSPTVMVVLFEDSAALLGLAVAAAGILLSYYTRRPVYDAGASIVIGLLLLLVAVFLARETKALLIGESAGPEERRRIRQAIVDLPEVQRCGNILTMHLGPAEILANIDVEFVDNLTTDEVEAAVDKIEASVRGAVPAVRKIYIEAHALKKGKQTEEGWSKNPR